MNVSFVSPGFLIALSLIAIPIVIHLFNFRKFRKVYFTNVKFLKELRQETTSRSKLKHLLVLASRILAVTFLVLAFAQPYIPAASGTKISSQRAVSIFVDNSFSMEAVTREGTLLDVARKSAKDIALSYHPSDQFQLLTGDFDPVNQRMLSREEFLAALDGIKISTSSRKLSEIIERQSEALSNSGSEENSAIVLSDFQKNMADLESVNNQTSVRVNLIPVTGTEVANISIDSCWFTQPVIQPNQPSELNIRIKNTGQLDASAVPVRLTINGVQKAVAAADVPSMNYTDLTLNFTAGSTGWQKAVVTVTDHPVVFDDQYYFSFKVTDYANMLSINSGTGSPYLNALFEKTGFFRLNEVNEMQIDYSTLLSNAVIFLNELKSIPTGLSAELKKYVKNGGTLVVVPDSAIDLQSYASFLTGLGIAPYSGFIQNEDRVQNIATDDPLFTGVFSSLAKSGETVDLPKTTGYFIQSGGGSTGGEVLMRLRSGTPFLSRHLTENGQVYLFFNGFSNPGSNFSRHAIFVPVIYRIALSSGDQPPLSWTIGKNDRIELTSLTLTGEQVLHLINTELGIDAIPGHRSTGTGTVLTVNNQITQAGHYELRKGDETVSVPSFNFNRDESDLRFEDAETLREMAAKFGLPSFSILDGNPEAISGKFSEINQGTRLWKYCIMLVLIFLVIETALLKFWKQ
jgi:hypothetical protein